MKLIIMIEILLGVFALAVLIYIYRDFFIRLLSHKKQEESKEDDKGKTTLEDITAANLIGKKKFKLISYKEALEESRKFIYDIAKNSHAKIFFSIKRKPHAIRCKII